LGSFLEAGAENLTCFGHCCPTKHGVSSQGKFENASSHDPPSSTLKFAWSFPFGQLTISNSLVVKKKERLHPLSNKVLIKQWELHESLISGR